MTLIRTAAQILADLALSDIPDDPDPEFMSTKEVAETLGISKEMVRYYSNKGHLPEAFRTVSNYRRFRTSDVRAVQKLLQATTAQTRLPARCRGVDAPRGPGGIRVERRLEGAGSSPDVPRPLPQRPDAGRGEREGEPLWVK